MPLPSLWILFMILGIASAIAGVCWIGKFLLIYMSPNEMHYVYITDKPFALNAPVLFSFSLL